MASIDLIKASDGSGNAVTANITAPRSPGATTLTVDSVTGIPSKFIGSMGTPHVFVDPVTSETLTVISEASAVDFAGHVDGSNLEIDTIAPGYTDTGSLVDDIVVIRPTTQWGDNLAAVLAASHDDDGTLKDGAVDSSSVMGTGVVGTTNIANAAVTTGTLAPSAVTPDKRSGGFKVGTIVGSTLGTTGNKSITGVGFTPRLVRFTVLPSASTTSSNYGSGAMTSSSQYYAAITSTGSGRTRNSSTTACIGWIGDTVSTPVLLANYVSMDADGFTINVTTASSAFDVAYEAYA